MALKKYEDCKAAIETALKTDDAAAHKAALTELAAFFEDRLGQKQAKDEKDGIGFVKKAIESKRTFKQYEPKTGAPEAAAPTLFGS